MNYITQIAKYKAKEKIQLIDDRINYAFEEFVKDEKQFKNIEDIYKLLHDKLNSITYDYIIFQENGNILFENSKNIQLNEDHLKEAMYAITNKNFEGKSYHFKIEEHTYDVYFYYSLNNFNYNAKFNQFNDSFILFKIKIDYINKILSNLYRFAFFIILIVIIFHIIFILFMHYIFIKPIKTLQKNTKLIKNGDYSIKINSKRKDEIGELSDSFNAMTDSINQKISELNDKNNKMIKDLKIASSVQKAIYPDINETELFNLAVFHEPCDLVSGDYHDIIKIKDNCYGILIADVSGHGVQAALITMRIKEAFNKIAKLYDKPEGLLAELNNELSDLLIKYNSCFTAFYLIIDEYNIKYSSASHCQALMVNNKTGEINYLYSKGPIIGISSDVDSFFESKNNTVNKNDLIVLLTDGIVEAKNKNNIKFDYERLNKIINEYGKEQPKDILQKIIEGHKEFTDIKNDDMTILILKIK